MILNLLSLALKLLCGKYFLYWELTTIIVFLIYFNLTNMLNVIIVIFSDASYFRGFLSGCTLHPIVSFSIFSHFYSIICFPLLCLSFLTSESHLFNVSHVTVRQLSALYLEILYFSCYNLEKENKMKTFSTRRLCSTNHKDSGTLYLFGASDSEDSQNFYFNDIYQL